jgi:hypothetical protein
VANGEARSQNAEDRRQKSNSGSATKRSRAGHPPASQRSGYAGWDRKKRVFILTNEANMLLKTQDRVYERTQTKPILHAGKSPAVTGKQGARFHSLWTFCPEQMPTTKRGEDSSWLRAAPAREHQVPRVPPGDLRPRKPGVYAKRGGRSIPIRSDFLYLLGRRVRQFRCEE